MAGSTTTVYLGTLWEETSAGATKAYYTFNGQTVAVRDSASGVAYLHSDHLGSVSVASGAGASLLSSQRFDPWRKLLSGGISQTRKNYTGQYLDTTGLLYYHARYYDPTLARFLSADTQISGQTDKTGAANPQNLNRYSYVTNNPLTHNDPTGHCPWCIAAVAGAAIGAAISVGIYAYNHQDNFSWSEAGSAALGGAVVGATAVILAPVVLAEAGAAVAGVGVATGSTSLLGAGTAIAGAGAAVGTALFGATAAADQGQMSDEEVSVDHGFR